jgi:ATP-dependent Clp protease ATP-binding subunit ClpX
MGVRSVSGLTRCDTVDTKNILFIAAGSFAGIEEVIADRLNKSAGIGFGSSRREKYDKTALYRHVTTDDIEEFGMIPEIVGRLPVITSIYELTEDELVRVLIEPKNALCKQFRGLFSLDGVDLQFDPEALREIARLAKKRSTGARALRAIMKAVLKSYSFEVPDQCDIASIRITAEAVHNPGAALIGRSPAAGTA